MKNIRKTNKKLMLMSLCLATVLTMAMFMPTGLSNNKYEDTPESVFIQTRIDIYITKLNKISMITE